MNYIKSFICICIAGLLSGASLTAYGQQGGESLQKDSVVVTQFSVVPEWSISSSISTVKGSKLEKTFTQNVLNTLYGELPGLTVMRGSGEPGADSPSINARGYNTFDTADRSVLVIIDGFEANLEQISVQEIESITLLKDAAAAALYGMRAANGVLLVTTKRGKVQPLEVSFTAQAGVNTPYAMPEFLGSYDYATLFNEARANDGLAPMYDETSLAAYKNGSDKYIYPDVNWYDEVLKNMSANQNYNLNFRGGNETVRYFALLNVSNNNGFFKGTDPFSQTSSNSKLTRYNVRANIDVNINKHLSAALNLAANITDQAAPAGGAWNVYNKLALLPPNSFPVYNPNGSFGGNASFTNPVGDLLETGLNSYNSRNIQSDLRLKYAFDKALTGLSLSVGFSFNNFFTGDFNKSKKYPYYQVAFADGEYAYNMFSEKTSMSISDSGADQWRVMNYLASINYDRTFAGKHRVNFDSEFFSDKVYDKTNSALKDSQFPYKYIGVRGRAAYAFNQKYMAEFVYNYMGSDLYYTGKRFGFFPAASLGWIVSNEDFLKNNKTLTYLKIRGSYGLVGSAAIVGSKRYAYTQDYKYTGGYYKGVTQVTMNGKMEDSVADLDRTWEKELRMNVGIEMTLWDKLGIEADYFRHQRSDLIVDPTGEIPAVLGMTFSNLNLGKATNSGFEATVTFADKVGDFEYYAKGSVWYAHNNIDYMAEELHLYDYQYKTGNPIGQPFGLVALGLFKDEADIANSPEQTFSAVKPGDIKYKDMNGDNVIDNQDTCPIGMIGTPEITGALTLGLKWKGLDFETMLYGVANRTAYLSGNTYWAFMNQYAAPISALGRWTEQTKDTAEYPRLSTQANANNTQYSSFWQRDGSFVKLKYVEIGYTLPSKASEALKLSQIRIFFNGTNLLGFSKMGKIANGDPEGLSGFPAMRTFSGGLKLNF